MGKGSWIWEPSRYTLEQFEQLLPQEGKAFELDEGELRVKSPGRPRHNRVREPLAHRLLYSVEDHQLGEIYMKTEFRLSSDTIRIPDVAFVQLDRVQAIDPDRPIEGAPALAVEVVSPIDLAEELARKVDHCLVAGAQAMWVLYLKARDVLVYQAERMSTTLIDSDVLEDEMLFPGLAVSVRDHIE